MRYFFYLSALCLMLAIVFAPSCKKADDGYTRALVIATNDLTPTGCGYLLRLNANQMVKPQYLSSAYQHDSLPVLVKYTSLNTQSNCMPQTPLDLVSIDDIKRDL